MPMVCFVSSEMVNEHDEQKRRNFRATCTPCFRSSPLLQKEKMHNEYNESEVGNSVLMITSDLKLNEVFFLNIINRQRFSNV